MNILQREKIRLRAIDRPPMYGLVDKDQPGAQRTVQALPQPRGFVVPCNITLVSQLILPIDLGRKWLFIQNFDPLGAIWAMWGQDARVNFGMNFKAGGGGILLEVNCPTNSLYIIGTIASNQNVVIITG